MKLFFVFYFIIVASLNSEAQQIYTIPWASQQPKFVFPIYFEEGTGQKDTLYLGYDPNASHSGFSSSDSVFGVYEIPIDTNNFYAIWSSASGMYCPTQQLLCTQGYKANVSTTFVTDAFPNGASISFNKGILPLKISWDVHQLRSDSLPYPGQLPLPPAQGNFYYGFSFCQIRENFITAYDDNGNVLISDTGGFVKDSLVIYNIFGNYQEVNAGVVEFKIGPWSPLMKIKDDNSSKVSLYKARINNHTLIFENDDVENNINVFDLSSRSLFSKIIRPNEIIKIPLTTSSIFIVQLMNNKYQNIFKIIDYEK